ncbi:hypothetical protein PFLA_a2607 [Pseudoalteromonas flavipulchra NCIMB 2033 = ATCC BAA-314]|nr:hypothetical protein [Pseudoalteromonas flavipulchra NCIMB 2033 = ATCC BAA-314]
MFNIKAHPCAPRSFFKTTKKNEPRKRRPSITLNPQILSRYSATVL